MGLVKTAELIGAALDWAVATANGGYPQWDADWEVFYQANGDDMDYSTDWSQGGPIIERERISLVDVGIVNWKASVNKADMYAVTHYGDTPLTAAMRCYVASKIGDEVEIPKELI